jgi:hypothetical protein
MAAGVCADTTVAGSADLYVSASHSQIQPGLKDGGLVVLAQLVQTFHKAVQTPNVVWMLGWAN